MKAIMGYCQENNICDSTFLMNQRSMAGTTAMDYAKQFSDTQALAFLSGLKNSISTESAVQNCAAPLTGINRTYTIPELADEVAPMASSNPTGVECVEVKID